MPKPISGMRIARSFIGNAATEETVELEFNIGTREAIEILAVLGTLAPSAVVTTATPTPVTSEQSLHLEDATLEGLGSVGASADQFNNDSEVIFHQVLSVIAFDGTTEAAGAIEVTPSGLIVFPEPLISPINLTHRVDNEAAVMDVGATLMIYYRYVELSDRELALEFGRRRR